MAKKSENNKDAARLALLEKIVDAEDLAGLLGLFIESQLAGGEIDSAIVHLTTPDGGLVCEAIHLPERFKAMEKPWLGSRIPFDPDNPEFLALSTAKPLLFDIRDEGPHAETIRAQLQRVHLSSLLIEPLISGGEPFGVVLLGHCANSLDAAGIARLKATTRLFEKPLAVMHDHQGLKRREQEIVDAVRAGADVFAFLETVNNLLSTDQVMEAIADHFLTKQAFDLACLFLVDAKGMMLRHAQVRDLRHQAVRDGLLAFLGDEPKPIDPADGATPLAYLRNTPFFFIDAMEITSYPMTDNARRAIEILGTPRTFVILPVRAHDKPIGVLWLITLEAPQTLPPQRRDLLGRLASFLGTPITNAGLYERLEDREREIARLNETLKGQVRQLQELAYRDGLTGLNNFGAFQNELRRRVDEYNRQSSNGSLAMALVDIDHFKNFNDSYGHMAGNEVLKELAHRMQEVARKMDIPCRYGGEEFVMILPKCRLEDARLVAERLRSKVAESPFATDQGLLPVTVSIGVTCFSPDEAMQDFFERADRALYRAKEEGRNRVVAL